MAIGAAERKNGKVSAYGGGQALAAGKGVPGRISDDDGEEEAESEKRRKPRRSEQGTGDCEMGGRARGEEAGAMGGDGELWWCWH